MHRHAKRPWLFFIKIDKSSDCLCKAAAGSSATKGALRRTRLLEELKRRLVNVVEGKFEVADGPQQSQSAVADDPNEVVDDLVLSLGGK